MDSVCHAQRNALDDHLHDRTVGIEAGDREFFRHAGLTRGRDPFHVLCNLLLLRSQFLRYPAALPLFARSLEFRPGPPFRPFVSGDGSSRRRLRRNPVRLTPIEVCQSALAARSDQPELFLRTCAFPAHFRSLHALLFFTASRFACF